MNRTTSRRQSLGFTLVELSTAMGIGAILLGQAVPAMSKMRQEQQLRATSETLAADLRFARSEAFRSSEPIFFRISGRGAQACYVLHTGAKDDCDCAGGQAVCKKAGSHVVKAEWVSMPVTLRSNAETLQFQLRQGLVTQTGSIDVSLNDGTGIRQVIAITGRVRSCYTGNKLGGLPRCA